MIENHQEVFGVCVMITRGFVCKQTADTKPQQRGGELADLTSFSLLEKISESRGKLMIASHF